MKINLRLIFCFTIISIVNFLNFLFNFDNFFHSTLNKCGKLLFLPQFYLTYKKNMGMFFSIYLTKLIDYIT